MEPEAWEYGWIMHDTTEITNEKVNLVYVPGNQWEDYGISSGVKTCYVDNGNVTEFFDDYDCLIDLGEVFLHIDEGWATTNWPLIRGPESYEFDLTLIDLEPPDLSLQEPDIPESVDPDREANALANLVSLSITPSLDYVLANEPFQLQAEVEPSGVTGTFYWETDETSPFRFGEQELLNATGQTVSVTGLMGNPGEIRCKFTFEQYPDKNPSESPDLDVNASIIITSIGVTLTHDDPSKIAHYDYDPAKLSRFGYSIHPLDLTFDGNVSLKIMNPQDVSQYREFTSSAPFCYFDWDGKIGTDSFLRLTNDCFLKCNFSVGGNAFEVLEKRVTFHKEKDGDLPPQCFDFMDGGYVMLQVGNLGSDPCPQQVVKKMVQPGTITSDIQCSKGSSSVVQIESESGGQVVLRGITEGHAVLTAERNSATLGTCNIEVLTERQPRIAIHLIKDQHGHQTEIYGDENAARTRLELAEEKYWKPSSNILLMDSVSISDRATDINLGPAVDVGIFDTQYLINQFAQNVEINVYFVHNITDEDNIPLGGVCCWDETTRKPHCFVANSGDLMSSVSVLAHELGHTAKLDDIDFSGVQPYDDNLYARDNDTGVSLGGNKINYDQAKYANTNWPIP
jgi:hypothetical protein